MLRLLYISCLLLSVLLPAQEIAVLQGRQRSGSPPQAELDLHARKITACLQNLSLPWKRVRDDHVTASDLSDCKVLFLPHNHLLPPESAAVVTAFVQSGGKLGVFYNQDPQILSLLGISRCRYVNRTDLGAISGLQFNQQAWPESPSFLAQRSYNLLEPVLDSNSPQPATILATFRSQDGQDSGRPGIVANQNGFYMSHVYLGQDNAAAQQFLLAFIGHWLPAVWQRLSEQRLQQTVDIAGLQSLDDLAQFCRDNGSDGGNRAEQTLRSAQKLQQEAQTAFTAKLYPSAYRLAGEAHRQARLAFALASPSRDGELRGAWLHSPYGIADWGWDKTVRVLAENGFNAIFPNLLWAYVADYPSAVLPQHPSLGSGRDKRDFLQECLDACRKYQVEMHVWKVNWFMGHRTPPALREEMQKAGRTQVTVEGQQTLFLAPHLEENFRLELESMLEIVQRYPVDGLHFDYIRYPDGNCDFSDSAKAAFEASLGAKVERWPQDCLQNGRLYNEYTLWRQENITRLVREVSQQAKALRPEIKISAAVYGNWESARFSVAQDALAWVEEQLLDFICPMNYESSAQEFAYYLQEQTRLVQNRLPVYPGIGINLLEDAAAAAEQIQLARQLGADGFICFQHNSTFATEFLPVFKEGISRLPAGPSLPHHQPAWLHTLHASRNPLLRDFYSLQESVFAEVTLPEKLNSSTMRLGLLRNGWELAQDCSISPSRSNRQLACRLACTRGGSYRLEIRGEDRQNHPLLFRSKPFLVLSAAQETEQLRREGPVVFPRPEGIKVAVWHDNAFGAQPILDFLQQDASLSVAVLSNLRPETLAACQVVIIPQPKDLAWQFKEQATGEVLNQYVKQGGGLLVTHALCGIRGFVNAVPEVVLKAIDPPLNHGQWKTIGHHPITQGLSGQTHASTFPFLVTLQPAKISDIVACSVNNEPVLVAGSLGAGRYAACGLGLGLGQGNHNVPLHPAEQTLLLNCIRWLAQANPGQDK